MVVHWPDRVLGLQLYHLPWFNTYHALEPPLVDLIHVDAAQVDLGEEPLTLLPLVHLVEVVFGVVEG